MRNITSSVRTMRGFELRYGRIVFREKFFQVADQLVQCGTIAISRIVDLIYSFGIRCLHSPDIHLDHIVDIREIPGIFTVAVDVGRFVVEELLDEERNDRSISAIGSCRRPNTLK